MLHFEREKFPKNHKYSLKITFSTKKRLFLIVPRSPTLRNLHFWKIQLFLHLVHSTFCLASSSKKSNADLNIFIFQKKNWDPKKILKIIPRPINISFLGWIWLKNTTYIISHAQSRTEYVIIGFLGLKFVSSIIIFFIIFYIIFLKSNFHFEIWVSDHKWPQMTLNGLKWPLISLSFASK